jgi:hypothetical protein
MTPEQAAGSGLLQASRAPGARIAGPGMPRNLAGLFHALVELQNAVESV